MSQHDSPATCSDRPGPHPSATAGPRPSDPEVDPEVDPTTPRLDTAPTDLPTSASDPGEGRSQALEGHTHLRVDAASRRLHGPGGSAALTAKECDLLGALIAGGGATVTRQHLLEIGWDATRAGTARSLDVHIATLRGKLLTAAGPHGARIRTVRGTGYRLVPAGALAVS